MPVGQYRIDYLDAEQAVRITTEGRLGTAEHKAFVLDALAEAGQRSCCKFIADHRQSMLDFSFMDVYEWPRNLKQFGVEPNMRVSIVIAEFDPKAADYRFFEDVSFNSGLPLMKVFSDYDRALDWLRTG